MLYDTGLKTTIYVYTFIHIYFLLDNSALLVATKDGCIGLYSHDQVGSFAIGNAYRYTDLLILQLNMQ